MDDPDLTLPRSDIERYAFVLKPLADLAGGRRHPLTGETFADLWARFPEKGGLRRVRLELPGDLGRS